MDEDIPARLKEALPAVGCKRILQACITFLKDSIQEEKTNGEGLYIIEGQPATYEEWVIAVRANIRRLERCEKSLRP